jgi:acetyl esterase/lipase
LCYPVISMGFNTHGGSKTNLLGPNPPLELVAEVSNELHVTSNTPPCFIWSTSDDATVPVENSLLFAAALRQLRVPFALHIYPHGKHGLGLGSKDGDLAKRHPWTRECELWLRESGFTK